MPKKTVKKTTKLVVAKRPDTYEKWDADGLMSEKLATCEILSWQGAKLSEIADELEISARTLDKMIKNHPSLKKAIKSQRYVLVKIAISMLIERVNAGDLGAIIYVLKIYGGEFYRQDRPANNKALPKEEEKPKVKTRKDMSHLSPEVVDAINDILDAAPGL